MGDFARYILDEEDILSKMEIVYFMAKKNRAFLDKSIIFKTEIVRMFLNFAKLDIDKNKVITAMLLCNCKKVNSAQDVERLHSYAKRGSEFLETLGFDRKFCKMCEEVNRYSESQPREIESDILEVADQFSGMLLRREDRPGFSSEEALILLKERNLKNCDNKFLDLFINFINELEKTELKDIVSISPIKKLVKMYNENDTVVRFMKEVVLWYEPKVDKVMDKCYNNELTKMLNKVDYTESKRPLFSEETTRKFIGNINNKLDLNM